MAVIGYWEKPGTGSVDNKGQRTYSRKWLVEMASYLDQPPTVWGTGFPAVHRYDPHPGDSGAVAVSLDCQPAGDQLGWYEVTIQYTSAPFDKGNQTNDPTKTDQSTAPPDRPWVVSFGSVHSERLLGPTDLAGKDVTNSVGQPFDPPPTIPCSNLQIKVTAFKDQTWDAATHIQAYQDAINNAIFSMVLNPTNTLTFPAKTVRCTEYNAQTHTENGEWYWQIDLTLEYRRVPWNPVQVLDAGTVYLKSGMPPQPILDQTGNPVNSPVPLDGTGHVLQSGLPLVYIDFRGYFEAGFATILS